MARVGPQRHGGGGVGGWKDEKNLLVVEFRECFQCL